MEWESPDQMIAEVRDLVTTGRTLAKASCCRELQLKAATVSSALFRRIECYRFEACETQNEELANRAYVEQDIVGAMVNHLQMWLLLRQDEADEAWTELVDAQRRIELALRFIDEEFLKHWYEELLPLEDILFPQQRFVSHAGTWGYSTCSICGGIYGDCCHLVGRLYMGHICRQIPQDIKATEHVAIVENPEDKACRFAEVEHDGFIRCTITRRKLRPAEGETSNAWAIVMRVRST